MNKQTERYYTNDDDHDATMRAARAMIIQYDDMAAELQPLLDAIKPFSDRLARLEAEIKEAVLRLGENVEEAGWKFTYRKGSEKKVIHVDSEALAGYAVAHPEVEAFITRSTKITLPSVAKSRT